LVNFYYYYFFFLPLALLLAPILKHRDDYSVSWSFTGGRTPWTVDQLVAKALSRHRTTQNTEKRGHTLNNYAQGGIRTCNHGLRAIENCSCLRPLSYHDRLYYY
jgi:hypothetical protein